MLFTGNQNRSKRNSLTPKQMKQGVIMKYDDNHRSKTSKDAVEYALAQFDVLKKGKPVRRPGWLYLDTLDAEERAQVFDGQKRLIGNEK